MRQTIPPALAATERTRLIERPDGFYWRWEGAGREYGPFATLLQAKQDMRVNDDAALEPGETLAQAQADIGIADWIDPETGDPAEEERPRIEEQ